MPLNNWATDKVPGRSARAPRRSRKARPRTAIEIQLPRIVCKCAGLARKISTSRKCSHPGENMKIFFTLILLSLAGGLLIQDGAAQSSYDLRSPDGRIEVRIRTAGQLRYDLLLKGTAVLENCTLSLDVEHQKLGVDPHVVEAKPSSHDEIVKPVVRQKFASIRDHYNELRLNMEDGYAVVFRAYNE